MRRATLALAAGLVVALTACASGPDGRTVLERLDDTPLACTGEPVERDESAGCETSVGALVASGHTDRAQAERTIALHLADGAAGRVVDGGSWTLLAGDEAVAHGAAGELDARVIDRLEQATGGCPDEPDRVQRLREALGDPTWC